MASLDKIWTHVYTEQGIFWEKKCLALWFSKENIWVYGIVVFFLVRDPHNLVSPSMLQKSIFRMSAHGDSCQDHQYNGFNMEHGRIGECPMVRSMMEEGTKPNW